MKVITVILIVAIFCAALLAQPAAGQPSPATLTPFPHTKTPPPAAVRQWLPVVAMRAAFIQDLPGYYTPTPAPP